MGRVEQPAWPDLVRDLAPREADLSTAELEVLARAQWWLCELPETLRLEERLHHRLVAENRPEAAVAAALRLAVLWGTVGDLTLGAAWLDRSRRLLLDLLECVQHGYAVYLGAYLALEISEDVEGASRASAELAELAGRFDDRSLESFSHALAGMAALRQGDTTGFASLNEAMLPVVSGQVDPLWGGDIYCSVIRSCEVLGDLGRMRAWTDALASWAQPLSSTFQFASVTRVHQLQLLRAEGDWDQVERELGPTSDRLASANGWVAGQGFYELGEVDRLRGRYADARAGFERARSLGIDPQPGEALLLDAEGHTTEALDLLRIAIAGNPPLERARQLPAAVKLALSVGDQAWASACATDLRSIAEHFGTPLLAADADYAQAACLLAAGDAASAVRLLDHAAGVYREQRHQHSLARAHEGLAQAYTRSGDEAAAAASAGTAAAIYRRLGASVDLARLTVPRPTAGLTPRELEVLAHICQGLSNRDVAQALAISEKTVSRHLTGIYTKAQVSSRTAAAAWAHEHRLV